MEEVFNCIYSDAFSDERPDRACLKAYWSLVQMYSKTIAATTDSLTGNSRFGVGALLRGLWKQRSDRNLVFITFNQDLVIEKSIDEIASRMAYKGIPWNLRRAYHMDARGLIKRQHHSHPFRASSAQSISVLKLHGSLNWLYSVRSGEDPRNAIRKPKGKPFIRNDRVIGRGATRLNRTGQRALNLLPLVVPPIYEKAGRYQAALRPVWTKARTALRDADELIVFGYSFPSADYAATNLFRRAFHENSRLSSVQVVDREPTVAARIADLLSATSFQWHTAVPSLLSQK